MIYVTDNVEDFLEDFGGFETTFTFQVTENISKSETEHIQQLVILDNLNQAELELSLSKTPTTNFLHNTWLIIGTRFSDNVNGQVKFPANMKMFFTESCKEILNSSNCTPNIFQILGNVHLSPKYEVLLS